MVVVRVPFFMLKGCLGVFWDLSLLFRVRFGGVWFAPRSIHNILRPSGKAPGGTVVPLRSDFQPVQCPRVDTTRRPV